MDLFDNVVIVRGGGDLATGVIQKLHRSGYKCIVLETAEPSAIRRTVSLCQAVYDGESTVEDITAKLVTSYLKLETCFENGIVPIFVDPDCEILDKCNPSAVVDAIIAKRNLGTERRMANATIALGPGFTAGVDVDIVIETMRGHNLGRILREGQAEPDTGTPGLIASHSAERVLHSQNAGKIEHRAKIGDIVKSGDIIAEIDGIPVKATIDGLLRGLIQEGYNVPVKFKIADIDPRIEEKENCFTISDKARALGGAVLESLLILGVKPCR